MNKTSASLIVLLLVVGGLAAVASPATAVPPVVVTVSPSTGDTNGGIVATITGSSFDTSTVPVVKFGGVPAQVCTTVPPTGCAPSTSASITVIVPPRTAAGAVDVTVINSDNTQHSLSSGFTYTAASAPTLASVSPSVGTTNGDDTVTLTGTNFATGVNKPTILFGNTVAQVTGPDAGAECSATSCTVKTPPHVAGAVEVKVLNPDTKSVTLAGAYTYGQAAAPDVTSLTPTSGPSTGGTVVTVTGTGFTAGSTVVFDSTAATTTTLTTPTTLTATTPAHATGAVDVVVMNPDGLQDKVTGGFFFQAASAPTLASLLPTEGPLVGGTLVKLTGTGFGTGSNKPTVSFGGTAARVLDSPAPSATEFYVLAPAHAVGAVSVVVTNPDGQVVTLASAFTYKNAILVDSVSPRTSGTNGGATVTITGSGFPTGSKVCFAPDAITAGGKCVTPAVSRDASGSGTTLTVTAPALADIGSLATIPTSVDVMVIAPDGRMAILEGGFTFDSHSDAPAVASISPVTGSSLGGTTVTVTGTKFATGGNKPSVCFDGTGATCAGGTLVAASSVNPAGTSITVTSPPHVGSTAGVVVNVYVVNPDLKVSNTLAGAYTYTGPASTAFTVSPTSGSAHGGYTVTLTATGANVFSTSPKPTVTFDGVPAEVTGAASTSLTVVVPAKTAVADPPATTVVTITVTNSDSTSGTIGFTYNGAVSPALTSISPTTGPSKGGTTLTITGTDFATGTIKPKVCFGGTGAACGSSGVLVTASSATATQVTVTTPSRTAAGTTVLVVNPDGKITSTASFTYTSEAGSAPTVTSLSLSSFAIEGGDYDPAGCQPATATTADIKVTVTGTNFPTTGTPPAVTFGTVSSPCVVVSSATSLTAVIPAAAGAGAVNLAVTNADTQSGSCLLCFTYLPDPPTLASLDDTSVTSNGGAPVTLTGTGYLAGQAILFGGNAAVRTGGTVATHAVTTPAHAAGAVTVQVVTAEGQSVTYPTSAAAPFTYAAAAAPTLASATPAAGAAKGGALVTLTGTNFATAPAEKPGVTFGGLAGREVTVTSATTLTVRTPAGPTGEVDIKVTNPDGQATTLVKGYRFIGVGLGSAPTLTAVAPTLGPLAGGTSVTLTGTNFATTGTVTVKFGATSATSVTVVSATQITAVTPAGSAGAVDVIVQNPDGQTATKTAGFTYTATAAPTVTAVSPITGPAAGGTAVTVTGTGFATTGTVTVTFGGTAGTSVTVASTTSLTVVTPAHAAGAVAVVVTNPDTQLGTSADAFTYTGTTTTTTNTTSPTPTATTTTSPPVVTESSLLTGNQALTASLRVELVGGDAVLTWTVPSGTPAPAGVQIWVQVNPVSILADLPAGSAEYVAGTWTVANAPADATYWITVYYGTTEALGFVENADAVTSLADLPAFAQIEDSGVVTGEGGDSGDGGFPWWGWLLIGLGVLLLVGLVILIVVLARRGGSTEEGEWDAGATEGWSEEAPQGEEAPWPEAPAAESPPDQAPDAATQPPAPEAPASASGPSVHQVTCPKCSAEFTAHGQKPLMIECPSCHVRGMLR